MNVASARFGRAGSIDTLLFLRAFSHAAGSACSGAVCEASPPTPMCCCVQALPFAALAYALAGITATLLCALPPVRWLLLAITG